MTPNIDPQILGKHLARAGEWGAMFYATPLVIDLFARRKVFFGRDENRFAAGDILKFDKGIAIEPYSSFNKTNLFCNAGAFSYFESWLPAETVVGRYSSIAPSCTVLMERHPIEWATTSSVTYDASTAPDTEFLTGPSGRRGYRAFIAAHRDFNSGDFKLDWPPRHLEDAPRIGNDVWICQDTRLMRGITIGTGSVIAAGALVADDVEPYMIVGGVPARVVRPRFEEKLIERFLQSKWWEYDVRIFKACDYKDPAKFLDDFERLKAETGLAPFAPEKITFRHILNELIETLAKETAA